VPANYHSSMSHHPASKRYPTDSHTIPSPQGLIPLNLHLSPPLLKPASPHFPLQVWPYFPQTSLSIPHLATPNSSRQNLPTHATQRIPRISRSIISSLDSAAQRQERESGLRDVVVGCGDCGMQLLYSAMAILAKGMISPGILQLGTEDGRNWRGG